MLQTLCSTLVQLNNTDESNEANNPRQSSCFEFSTVARCSLGCFNDVIFILGVTWIVVELVNITVFCTRTKACYKYLHQRFDIRDDGQSGD